VKPKVKNNFESANSLMLSATKAYLCSAFMQWAGLDSLEGTPKKIKTLDPNLLDQDKQEYITTTIGEFVDEYIMVECDVEKSLQVQREQAQQQSDLQAQQQLTQQRSHQPAQHQSRKQNKETSLSVSHTTQAASGVLNAVTSPTLKFQTG
jgi:DNA-binding NarL/FixJ family response regulator